MKKPWTLILLLVLSVILIVFVIPIVLANTRLLTISEFQSLLSIVVSWPTAILIISLLFITRFHEAIDSLLMNIGSMKFPGGFEFQRQNQPPAANETEIDAENLLALPNEEKQSEVDGVLKEIQKDSRVSESEVQLLQQQYSQLAISTRLWKFSYLNLYFVPQTKNVLSWFAKNPPQSRQSYDILWTPYIFDQNQRNTILGVLLQNGMLVETDGLIRITEEGYAFLQFIGYIPPAPVQQPA